MFIAQDTPAGALPLGTPEAARLRWQGVLRAADLDWCRRAGVPLGYDPAQAGWVVMPAEGFADDSPEAAAALSHHAGALSFRPWGAADAPAFRALLDDPAVWQHLPEAYPAPLTEAVAADLIALSAAPHHEVSAVVQGGAPLGQVRLEFARHGADRSSAELSYWFGRAHWGRGLARRALAAAIPAAFARHAGLARLTARVRPQNEASRRLLARMGFLPDDAARAGGWLGFTLPRPPAAEATRRHS